MLLTFVTTIIPLSFIKVFAKNKRLQNNIYDLYKPEVSMFHRCSISVCKGIPLQTSEEEKSLTMINSNI